MAIRDGIRRVLDLAYAAFEAPEALRRRLMLERATYRLTTCPERTVHEVAIEAGYSLHEGFTRSFVRAYGRPRRQLRADPPLTFRHLELSSTSGVHFHPPGGIRLPAPPQETVMDITQLLVDHHVESLTAMVAAADDLPATALDQIVRSVEGVDESIAEGRLADAFIDSTCEPLVPQPLVGTIAHVIAFGAVRRTMAVGALWSGGVRDFDRAEPRPYVDTLVTS